MKITVEYTSTAEKEIIIKCQQLDSEIHAILSYLQVNMDKIIAFKDSL